VYDVSNPVDLQLVYQSDIETTNFKNAHVDGNYFLTLNNFVCVKEITGVNDLPEIDLPEYFSFVENSTLSVDFSPYVSDVDLDEVVLTVNQTENIIVEIEDLIVTMSAEDGWIGSEELFFIVNDNQAARPTCIDSTIVIVTEYWEHSYGDIDDNGNVESYDAALILQYVVGIDPEPAAPLPWEDWQNIAAEVSGNQIIGAYDASLVLQYYVGIIYAFPVEIVREDIMFTYAEVCVKQENGVLQFDGYGEIYSIELELNEEIKNYICQDNIMTVTRENKLAMASAIPITGNILSIPVNQEYDNLVIIVNDQYYELLLNESVEPVNSISVYPNPFNPVTNIHYELAESGSVLLEIYNIKGQKVETLVDSNMEAGKYSCSWNAEDFGSGIYFILYRVGTVSEVRKIILLK
jgi:hypothetical protein